MKGLFSKKLNNWGETEAHIQSLSTSQEIGDAFEHFVYFFFLFHRDLYQIREVYCPVVDRRPFPEKVLDHLKLEKRDHGVDGVFVTESNEFIAWQAKFRSGRISPSYAELSTFWTEAENANFRLIIANSTYLPSLAQKKAGHLSILVDHFIRLKGDFFESFSSYLDSTSKSIKKTRKEPRDYQSEILSNIVNGFKQNAKGKLIAACGIGKTLISLWTSEDLGADTIVFFAPSLQLIRQTLQEWAMEASIPFSYLCVCSDQTVHEDVDENNIGLTEIDIPVTTNSVSVALFLSRTADTKRKIIFSTYQSSTVLSEAIRDGKLPPFDLAIYDEAHRTAGISSGNLFSGAVNDQLIPAHKKLFMTATERLVRPRVYQAASVLGNEVFSMSDEGLYGKVFHRMTFGEAIEKGIISDYRIVFSGTSSDELNSELKANKYVREDIEGGIKTMESLYKSILLRQSYEDLGVRKVVSFHSKIVEAKAFESEMKLQIENAGHVCISHVNGSMSSQRRAEIIDEFEQSDLGLITNVRCLTEGIDIPMIDAVFFADPKGSLIDIVQAVGRALRQPFGSSGKIAYIIVPVLIDRHDSEILSGRGFQALFNLLQAMRDQDSKLAEWIDSINLSAAKGKGGLPGTPGKLIIRLPPEIDLGEFSGSLILKVADINKDPRGTIGVGSKLGKSERKGSFSRVYKTLCDYTPEKLRENLIDPTLKLILDSQKLYPRSELYINNNNVSHSERLGMIQKVMRKSFRITPIGDRYQFGEFSFLELMQNQMLLFKYDRPQGALFPYRLAMEFMKSLKKMNLFQFIYGLYSIQFGASGSPDLTTAIEIARKINKDFPNLHISNEANKPTILSELNQLHPVGFGFNDVWTDRTTTGNQFRYLIRHLELFPEIFEYREKSLHVLPGGEHVIDEILNQSQLYLHPKYFGSKWWLNEKQ